VLVTIHNLAVQAIQTKHSSTKLTQSSLVLCSTGNPYGFQGNAASDIVTNAGADLVANHYTTGIAMTTAVAEGLGADTSTGMFNQMAFSIEKVTVTAQSRALKLNTH
jgi:hypothetical protein